jgi:hypothetical protein
MPGRTARSGLEPIQENVTGPQQTRLAVFSGAGVSGEHRPRCRVNAGEAASAQPAEAGHPPTQRCPTLSSACTRNLRLRKSVTSATQHRDPSILMRSLRESQLAVVKCLLVPHGVTVENE